MGALTIRATRRGQEVRRFGLRKQAVGNDMVSREPAAIRAAAEITSTTPWFLHAVSPIIHVTVERVESRVPL